MGLGGGDPAGVKETSPLTSLFCDECDSTTATRRVGVYRTALRGASETSHSGHSKEAEN